MPRLDATSAGAGAGALGVLILVGLYLLPGIVASSRGAKNAGSVWVIDILLGWSLIGWVVALAMAFGETKADDTERLRRVMTLTAGPATPRSPGTTQTVPPVEASRSKFCTGCGAPAGSGTFCAECGAKLPTQPTRGPII